MAKEKSEIRVGFLLINTVAHLYHAAPIAFELSFDRRFRVVLYVSTQENRALLEALSRNYPGHACKYVFLRPTFLHRVIRLFKKRLHPRVRDVIANNKKLILRDDALVMTDKHMLEIQAMNRPKYICTGHGAGDRACAFSPQYKKFDYLLVAGDAKWRRLEGAGIVSPEMGRVVGYPKFDSTLNGNGVEKVFSNGRPVVLYNPHFNQNESSWYKWGEAVLDYFYESRDYNLIFAPHILLFSKKRTDVAVKYHEAENIHVDVGSNRLADMSYVRMADIYLGDVSSQVYEFVGCRPRPCVFLNAQKADWMGKESFRMWNMGDVVHSMGDFEYAMASAQKRFANYEEIQTAYSDETFSKSDMPAGRRAAESIAEFMLRSDSSHRVCAANHQETHSTTRTLG